MITQPGIYDISEKNYHADAIAPVASLSHSVAKLLLKQSPLHAKTAHPRLTPQPVKEVPTSAMDKGSALHKLILGKGAEIKVLAYDDYRKKEAQAERDTTRAKGLIPLLAEDYNGVRACATAALEQMREHPDLAAFFAPGQSEAVMVWRDGATWCRAMADRLPANPRAPIYDIKMTGVGSPEAWERRLITEYATQAAFYRDGAKAIRGVEPGQMLFVVIEDKPPYAVSVMACAPSLAAYAEHEIARARATWARCMATGEWPGYTAMTAYVEAPAWLQMRQEERAIRDEIVERYRERENLEFGMMEFQG